MDSLSLRLRGALVIVVGLIALAPPASESACTSPSTSDRVPHYPPLFTSVWDYAIGVGGNVREADGALLWWGNETHHAYHFESETPVRYQIATGTTIWNYFPEQQECEVWEYPFDVIQDYFCNASASGITVSKDEGTYQLWTGTVNTQNVACQNFDYSVLASNTTLEFGYLWIVQLGLSQSKYPTGATQVLRARSVNTTAPLDSALFDVPTYCAGAKRRVCEAATVQPKGFGTGDVIAMTAGGCLATAAVTYLITCFVMQKKKGYVLLRAPTDADNEYDSS